MMATVKEKGKERENLRQELESFGIEREVGVAVKVRDGASATVWQRITVDWMEIWPVPVWV